MASWWSTDGVLDSLDLEENSIVSRVIQAVGLFGDILSLEDTMEPMLSKVRGDRDGDQGTAPGDEQMVESFQETKDEEKVTTEEEDRGEKEENEGDQEAGEWKNKNESKEEEEEKEDVDWMWKAQTQGQQEKERREEDRTEEEDRSTESDKDEEKRLKEDNDEVLQEVGWTVEEELESEKDTGGQDEEEMEKNEDQMQSEEEEMEEKEKDVMKEEKYNDREKEKEEEVDEERKNQERSTVEEKVEESEDMDEEVKKEKKTTEIKGHEHHTENEAEEVEKENNKQEVDGTEGEMETAAGREENAEDEEEDEQENQLSQSESQNSSAQSQRQDLDFAEALSHDVGTESGADRVLTDEEKGSVTAKDHGGDIYPTSPSKDKECEDAFLSSSDASAQTASESATDTHLPSVDARLHCADPAGPSDVQSETEDHGRDTTPELHTDLLASSLMDAAAQSSMETRPGNKELSPAINASSTGNTAMETKDKEEGGQNSPQMNGEMDDKNNGSRQSLKYKTVSYRRIRKGNTKQRIDEFEAMMNS